MNSTKTDGQGRVARPVFLMRYDTEEFRYDYPGYPHQDMTGFLEKAVEVHRADAIPATFFITGKSLDTRPEAYRDFYAEVADDPLFDIQCHSYSHIGIGYATMPETFEELEEDFTRAFDTHARLFGPRPQGVSICGYGHPRLSGFDENERGRRHFQLLVDLGIEMINSFLVGVDESREFCNYARLGHPEIMGFPSDYSDTSIFAAREFGDPMTYMRAQIEERASRGDHFPCMLHDWAAWHFGPDRELGHVRQLAEWAREAGYEMLTHMDCMKRTELWR